LEFERSANAVHKWIDQWGIIPLPPYIHRDQIKPAVESPDRLSYQTVFAKDRGSVAAPTAGLHFSQQLLDQLSEKGINLRFLSLHVGAGTFLPVKSDSIENHTMHHESFMVPRQTLQDIFQAKQNGSPVIAVGTTSLRSLEDLYRKGDGDTDKILNLGNQWHETNLFLYPKHKEDRYTPWMIDGLITNFHQPKSTLFMLISLLLGLENAMNFYQFAFDKQFRLFSYGDSSLLWLTKPQNGI
jgi:S-adenosylmethionine:tRNA ribosyltransferase-isomerase